jgi:hypothetical protein
MSEEFNAEFKAKKHMQIILADDDECSINNLTDVLENASELEEDIIEHLKDFLYYVADLDEKEVDELDFFFEINNAESQEPNAEFPTLVCELGMEKTPPESEITEDSETEILQAINSPNEKRICSTAELWAYLDEQVKYFEAQLLHIFTAEEQEWVSL